MYIKSFISFFFVKTISVFLSYNIHFKGFVTTKNKINFMNKCKFEIITPTMTNKVFIVFFIRKIV